MQETIHNVVVAVVKRRSDWLILLLREIRREEVEMDSTLYEAKNSLRFRGKFSGKRLCANFLRICIEKFASHEFIRLVKVRLYLTATSPFYVFVVRTG